MLCRAPGKRRASHVSISSNRPVVHSEAAEARDNHRVVPLPLYDTTGKLIAPSCYKDSVAAALVCVNFTLTHCGSFQLSSWDPMTQQIPL